jgi:AcrR family transcriptional regulator
MADDDWERVRRQIVTASVALVATEGFGVQPTRIAEAAGVDPELIPQYFATRELLNTATIGELWDLYDGSLDNAPAPGDDIGAWIDALSAYVHNDNFELFGQGFWDLALSASELTGGLVDLVSERRWLRGRWSRTFAEAAWRGSGRKDEPPAVLVRAFDMHLNAFSTNGLLAIGFSREEIAVTTGEILKAVLDGLLE